MCDRRIKTVRSINPSYVNTRAVRISATSLHRQLLKGISLFGLICCFLFPMQAAHGYQTEPDWETASSVNTILHSNQFTGNSTHRNITTRAVELVGQKSGYTDLASELRNVKMETIAGVGVATDINGITLTAVQYGSDWEDFSLISNSDRIPLASLNLSTRFSIERNLNHSYNPYTNKGGPLPKPGCWNQPSPFNMPMNAKDWANAPANDFSWDKAVQAYKNGHKLQAYTILGHIAHLLADVSARVKVVVASVMQPTVEYGCQPNASL